MAHGRIDLRNRPNGLVSVALAGLLFAIPPAYAANPVEFAVKAAFIYKFISYVQWPAAQMPSASSPITLCVAGSDGVGAQLDLASAGQHSDQHPIVIRHLENVSRNGGCNVLYIAESDSETVAADLGAVGSAPILTITDGDRTPATLGIISFVIDDNHVRFNIDNSTATANGLTISSRLLALARNVRQKG